VVGVAGLRDLHKRRRRAAILAAARDALRSVPADKLTVEDIAARAEVAPATVYNLIGPRERLYAALLDDLLDQLDDRLGTMGRLPPLERALAVVDTSIDLFVADPDVWRPVVTRLTPGLRHQPARLQIDALEQARAAGLLRADADTTALGTQVLVAYTGALFSWAGGELTAAGFRVLAHRGLDVVVAAAAADEDVRAAALARIAHDPTPTPDTWEDT
jgi:AcrR family transcriptional regulator